MQEHIWLHKFDSSTMLTQATMAHVHSSICNPYLALRSSFFNTSDP